LAYNCDDRFVRLIFRWKCMRGLTVIDCFLTAWILLACGIFIFFFSYLEEKGTSEYDFVEQVNVNRQILIDDLEKEEEFILTPEAHEDLVDVEVYEELLVDSTRLTVDTTCYTHTGNNMANGVYPEWGYVASNQYEFGTEIYIPYFDKTFIVGDTIGHSSSLDIFFDSYEECISFGRRQLEVVVYN